MIYLQGQRLKYMEGGLVNLLNGFNVVFQATRIGNGHRRYHRVDTLVHSSYADSNRNGVYRFCNRY